MNPHRETLILASMESELEKISFWQAGVKAVSESGLGRAVKGGFEALGTTGRRMRADVTRGKDAAFKAREVPHPKDPLGKTKTVYDQQGHAGIKDWAKLHGGRAMEWASKNPKKAVAGTVVGAGVTGRALT